MKKFFLFLLTALFAVNVFAEYEKTAFSFEGRNIAVYAYLPNANQYPCPAIFEVPTISGNGTGTLNSSSLKSKLHSEGYAFFSVDYSADPSQLGKQYPLQIREIKATLQYLRGYYGDQGVIDTSFIAVAGFSFGGYVAAMTGVTRNIDTYTIGDETWNLKGSDSDKSSISVDAVIVFSAPVDFRDIDGCNSFMPSADAQSIGCSYADCPDKWELASVYTYITKDAAPTIIFHDQNDNIAPYCKSETFYNNLQAAGVDCEFYTHTQQGAQQQSEFRLYAKGGGFYSPCPC